MPTPKLPYGAIFQPVIPKPWQECFNTTIEVKLGHSEQENTESSTKSGFPMNTYSILQELSVKNTEFRFRKVPQGSVLASSGHGGRGG